MAVRVTDRNTLISINPATLEEMGEVPCSSLDAISKSVADARVAYRTWKKRSLSDRLAVIARFGELVMENRDKIAQLITRETGKPLVEAQVSELFGVLETVKWLRTNAAKLLAPQKVSLNKLFFYRKRSYNVFEPFGVVAIVAPWNYPFCIPVSSALSALAAGNAVVFKLSPKTPLLGQLIESLFAQAGFTPGLVSMVTGDRLEAAALVNDKVDRVVFTGSVGGGKAIMGMCVGKLHPVTLELGGKHPAIVLADADVDAICESLVWAAFTNAGQACASIERLYVVRPLAEKLIKALAERTKKLRLGNGLDPDVDVGPLIDELQLANVERLVQDAVKRGARLVTGGRRRDDLGGFFYEPAVLADVTQDMPIAREEIFGPALPIITVDSEEEAIALANDSHLALGASIWTKDIARAELLARELDTGMVWINDSIYSHACAETPWGGIKDSGFGRSHGDAGLHEFVYIKHIGVDSQHRQDWQFPYSKARADLITGAMDLLHGKTIRKKVGTVCKTLKAWWQTR